MADKIAITNNIRRLRFFANEMTQLELSEQAGISRQTVVALEAGKYIPSLEIAFKIADVFGVGVEEVFERKVFERKAEGEKQ
jgi:putative transcriptional regulator